MTRKVNWRVKVFSCTLNRSLTVEVRAEDWFDAWTKAVERLNNSGYYGRLFRESCRRA